MFKQCKLYDKESECYLGGIAYFEVDDNDNETLKYVICGCCGAIFEPNDFDEDGDFQLIRLYADWVDLSEAICDNLEDEESEDNE